MRPVSSEGLTSWSTSPEETRTHGVFEETGDEIWLRLLDLNLVGVARVCRAAIPFLRRSDRAPAIVTVSSINAHAPLGSEPYSSAKAGLTALTKNLAIYLARDGIRVNAVAPGTIRTRVWESQEGGAERMKPLYPLGRVGEPEDVAGAVAFLASTDAAWITGHTLPVEGGLSSPTRRSRYLILIRVSMPGQADQATLPTSEDQVVPVKLVEAVVGFGQAPRMESDREPCSRRSAGEWPRASDEARLERDNSNQLQLGPFRSGADRERIAAATGAYEHTPSFPVRRRSQ